MTDSPKAWAAPLTAPSRGAIGVIRVWGPEALGLVDSVFRPHRRGPLSTTSLGRPRVGWVGSGDLSDEVVVVVEGRADQVEVHCHGGPLSVSMVLKALGEAGAEMGSPAAWIDWTTRCSLRSAALTDLAQAPTVRTAEILLEQANGALDRELERLARLATTDHYAALKGLDRLLERTSFGTRLLTGWSVAIAGRPNVGKSQLLNAIAGFERAIVSPMPGTTRDPVSLRVALEGLPFELIDTAGLRETVEPIEAAGIALARASQSRADLVVLVLDQSEPLTESDWDLIRGLPDALRVASKCDLPSAWDFKDLGALPISAHSAWNLGALITAIVGRLVPSLPDPDSAVPFRVDHGKLLQEARNSIADGRIEEAIELMRRLNA